MMFYEMTEDEIFEEECELRLESAELELDRAITKYDIAAAMESFENRSLLIAAYESGEEEFFEASADAAEKKQNALQRAWGAIVKFIRNIKERLLSKLRKPEKNQEVAVDKKTYKAAQKIKGLVTKAKSVINKGKVSLSKLSTFKKAIIAIAAIAGVAIVGTRVVKNKATEAPKSEFKGSTNTTNTSYSIPKSLNALPDNRGEVLGLPFKGSNQELIEATVVYGLIEQVKESVDVIEEIVVENSSYDFTSAYQSRHPMEIKNTDAISEYMKLLKIAGSICRVISDTLYNSLKSIFNLNTSSIPTETGINGSTYKVSAEKKAAQQKKLNRGQKGKGNFTKFYNQNTKKNKK